MKKTHLMGILLPALLAGCMGGGDDSPVATGSGNDGTTQGSQVGRVFFIEPGPDATKDMVEAMVQLKPLDILRFDCGFFDLTEGLQITQTENVTVEGCGKDKTFLSFANSTGQEGFLASNVQQIKVQDLTIGDSPGDAFKMKSVNHGQLINVRAIWSSGRKTEQETLITANNWQQEIQVECSNPVTANPATSAPDLNAGTPGYIVSNLSGRYGIYPVESRNIFVDNTESIGASDAGIYVGQTNIAKIQNSRAAYNVFGFEIENVQDGEYSGNLAECNTGGFLVYDLDGLTRYGKRSRMFNNVSRNNNTYNFATPGSIVANVPRGSGFITLAYDKIDIYDNVFEDNGTAGIILTSYELLGIPGDRRMDYYTEGVNIFNNTFKNNGNDLPNPDFAAIIETEGGQVSSAFPMLVGLKNAAGADSYGYSGAHIVWDGYEDALSDCPPPVDFKGEPVPVDEEGKPIQGNQYPNPDCVYNAYKFDDQGNRIVPAWWFSCINPNNGFDADSRSFANFHGTRGLEAVFAVADQDASVLSQDGFLNIASGIQEFASDFSLAPHDCLARFGADLPRLPDFEFEPYEPSGKIPPAANDELTTELCGAPQKAGEVNEEAFVVNCPDLASYNLFADEQDPTSSPNSQGMPYVLNTKLFSDYSLKHRVIFIPTGKQAAFIADEDIRPNSVIDFPVGTIIAKTFTFLDQRVGTETPYETRLLIKRERNDGVGYWEALEYIWDNSGAQKKAVLTQRGGSAAATWSYTDPDTGKLIEGSTNAYLFPNANQCSICHSNLNVDAGSAPIGPKPRNLNRVFVSESPMATGQSRHPVSGQNQLKFMCDNGLMTNCPSDLSADARGVLTQAGHIPKYNVPGDSGFAPNSKEDIESRTRAYLEVNCAHCHNLGGQASNTGFYMDSFRAVDGTFGICKKPTASGSEGRGGRLYDIHPGRAVDSILPYRIGEEAVVAAAKMPPLARSVVHAEAFDLISQWIDTVVDNSYANADACVE